MRETKVGPRKVRLRHRVMPNRSSSQTRDLPVPLGPTFLTLRAVSSAKWPTRAVTQHGISSLGAVGALGLAAEA